MSKADSAVDAAWERSGLTPEQIEEYEERRAILQFDGGMDEFEAAKEALRICHVRWQGIGLT